jgi:LmbE family N-acetylglucosaminyl deacetylase
MSDYVPQISDASIPEMAVRKVDSSREPPVPRSAMAIHAHPDDQEFTIAGTLAKWARAGSEITSVVITSGDAGSNDPRLRAASRPALARLREAEQLAACRVLGVMRTIFLHYPDGELVPDLSLRRALTRVIRTVQPEVVLCGDPTAHFYGNSYVNHPDHRAAAQAACDAVFPSAGTRLIFPELLEEGFEPHNVRKLLVHGVEKPDTWIDIAETIEVKIAALQEHKSQVGGSDIGGRIRQWAADDGKQRGLACAETYRVMILVDEN